MNVDTWTRFQLAPTAERLALMGDPRTREQLAPLLGDAAVRGYVELAGRLPRGSTLGPDHLPNLVFVPGVMGSVLASRGRGGVWWLDVRTLDRLKLLGLTADGTADADAGARLDAVVVDSTYDSFCTAVLAQPDFGHLTFAYDWRRPIPSVADGLAATVRSAFAENGGRRVHLVAHSMGGLVVREALRADPQLWDLVGRIAFLGTPHHGSPAIAGYLKNHLWGFEALALLGELLPRETLRSMWGVLDLLPAPPGAYPGSGADWDHHPCANFDVHDAAAYRLGLDRTETSALQRGLDAARRFHTDLADAHRALPQQQRDRMLVVAGVGYRTLFRTAYRPRFGFLWEHMDRVTRRVADDRHREGDGRVPLASAQLDHVGATRYVRGRHGQLPAMPAVQTAVLDWLRGDLPTLPGTPQAALAARLSGDDAQVDQPELAPPHGQTSDPEDPGYLDLDPPDDAVLAARREDVEAGRMPEFTRVKLL